MTTIEVDNICYLLDEDTKTASVTKSPSAKGDIIIPRSIDNNSKEYIITSILEFAFQNLPSITSVQFAPHSEVRTIEKMAFSCSSITKVTLPPHLTTICEKTFYVCAYLEVLEIPADSELKTIEDEAFFDTSIESLKFPSTLCELKTRWCYGMAHLKNVSIDIQNPIFKTIGNQIILSKSSPEKVDFDVLVFSSRDTEIARIPDSIETIQPFAFEGCRHLSQVFINTSSRLRNIDDNAFMDSSIEGIWIPPSLRRIGSCCFYNSLLKIIEISSNSELRTIESKAFFGTPVESIFIPKHAKLEDGWCEDTSELNSFRVSDENLMYKDYNGQMIIGKSSIESDKFDVLCFVNRDVKKVTIPSFIEMIACDAFERCRSLSSVVFTDDSNLRVIGRCAFASSSIKYLTLPPHLTKICVSAFLSCSKLRRVGIPIDSDINSIENRAFSKTEIECFTVPRHLTCICADTFANCRKLKRVVFPGDCKVQSFEKNAFSISRIESMSIPSTVKFIGENVFTSISLQIIEVPEDSQLSEINSRMFSRRKKSSLIMIPAKLSYIAK